MVDEYEMKKVCKSSKKIKCFSLPRVRWLTTSLAPQNAIALRLELVHWCAKLKKWLSHAAQFPPFVVLNRSKLFATISRRWSTLFPLGYRLHCFLLIYEEWWSLLKLEPNGCIKVLMMVCVCFYLWLFLYVMYIYVVSCCFINLPLLACTGNAGR